jgi:hypothetical protein
MASNITPVDSFHAKFQVITETGCWIWTAALSSKGYGVLGIGNRKIQSAHKFSYEHFIGKVEEGLVLDHLCRVRCCVNPYHLDPITNKLNLARGINSNREKTHCKRGHKLLGDNLYIDPKKKSRGCKECKRSASRKFKKSNAGK